MRLLGAFLVFAGTVFLIYGGFTLFVPSGDLWLGSMSITLHENLVIPLPPILGLICLVLGVAMVMSGPVEAPPPPYLR
jgi:hypothetical protein